MVTYTMFAGIVLTFLHRMFLMAKYPVILSFNVQSAEPITKSDEENQTFILLLIDIKLQNNDCTEAFKLERMQIYMLEFIYLATAYQT